LVLKNALDYVGGKEWQAKPAAFISDGATNGSHSVSQIRPITSSFGMLDPNAVLAIRDMFKPKK
jgi:NAD(P)H-dependent FMN reductase